MNNGTQFAVALVLFWIAGLSFFVALHPGGIKFNGKDAKNPAQVIGALISSLNTGAAGNATPSSTPGPVPAQPVAV